MNHPPAVLPAFGGQRLLDADREDAPLVQVLTDDANSGLMDLGMVVANFRDGSCRVLSLKDGLVDATLGGREGSRDR